MHEYSLACEIVDHIIEISQINDAKLINSITIGIGKLTHVNCEQISFCIEELIKDTIAEKASIIIEDIYPEVQCSCGFKQNSKNLLSSKDIFSDDIRLYINISCPICGEKMHEIDGRDLIIKSIDIEI